MSDSVDRVFAHALNTVKKIPRTGSARPPLEARMKLYGLYKQSMEGDVEGVMEQPEGEGDDLDREREKWDAWAAQKGLSRTEAKRRYISTLIDTMHQYASTTPEARELVSELEFVWDQIKDNPPSSSDSSSPLHGHHHQHAGSGEGSRGVSGTEGSYYPLGVSGDGDYGGSGEGGGGNEESVLRQLSPVSTEGEEEEQEEEEADDEEAEVEEGEEFVDASQYAEEATRQVVPHPAAAAGAVGASSRTHQPQISLPPKEIQQDHRRWRRRIESALVKMTAEIAALREQLEAQTYNLTGSGVRRKRSRWWTWGVWVLSNTVKLVIADMLLFSLLLVWMRRRGDLWLERVVVNWLQRAKRKVRSVEAGRVVGEKVGRIGLAGRTALRIGRGGGG